MSPANKASPQETAHLQGDRHLQLMLEIEDDKLRLKSMAVVDEPIILPPTTMGSWFARVERYDSDITVQSFPDPRYGEGIGRPDNPLHSQQVLQPGAVKIRVPLATGQPLPKIDIKVFDASESASPATPEMIENLTRSTRGVKLVGSLDDSTLRKHPDWPKAAPALTDTTTTNRGYFEIYLDERKRHRWRLRRPGGAIVAASGRGYATREECEKDLRWIKEQASTMSVRSLDLSS